MRRLVLHIGLPKTGTTTLQQDLFPALERSAKNGNFIFLGRKHPRATSHELSEAFISVFLAFARGGSYLSELKMFANSIRSLSQEVAVISEENLSIWPHPKAQESSWWPVEFRGPSDIPRQGDPTIVEFLEILRANMIDVDIRVIITFRNQSDFLGSLAAQLSSRDPDFYSKVVKAKEPYLNFGLWVRSLARVLGKSNMCVLIFEDGLETNALKIARFLKTEPLDLVLSHQNSRAGGGDGWQAEPSHAGFMIRLYHLGLSFLSRLPRVKQQFVHLAHRMSEFTPKSHSRVQISDDQRNNLRRIHRVSNQELEAFLNRDLERLGY